MESSGSANSRTERTSPASKLPTDPARVEAFANFFKRYMSVSTVVVAALPIPATSLGVIPTYHFQTKLLSVYTSLFCFLVLAFIFYNRHVLARWMFVHYFEAQSRPSLIPTVYTEDVTVPVDTSPEEAAKILEASKQYHELERQRIKLERQRAEESWKRRRNTRDTAISLVPLGLILLSLGCVFAYHAVLTQSAERYDDQLTFDTILQQADQTQVAAASLLMFLYLGIFITAEAAFVMMAMKEYLQDYLQLDDKTLIRGRDDDFIPPELMTMAMTMATRAAQKIATRAAQKPEEDPPHSRTPG